MKRNEHAGMKWKSILGEHAVVRGALIGVAVALVVAVGVLTLATLYVGVVGGLSAIKAGWASRPDDLVSSLLVENWIWVGWFRGAAALAAAIGCLAGVVAAGVKYFEKATWSVAPTPIHGAEPEHEIQ